jgi:uncharacterized protein (TIGR03437 family)
MRSYCVTCFVAINLLIIRSVSAQTLNPNPSRVVGQRGLDINSLAPNLVEGRELNSPTSVAIDTSASPAILYVSDSGNNRVLAWKDATQFANGAQADKVIGQKDFLTTLPQGPGRSSLSTGLTGPAGLAVDSAGNLYVVDTGNNRILRFPKPFSQSDQILPDLVIGQPDFSTRVTNQGGISARSMALNNDTSAPDCQSGNCYNASLAFDNAGNLYFTDPLNNRILRYPASVLGPKATNGPPADLVLGETDFSSAVSTDDPVNIHNLRTPAGIALDSGGRLYVSDSLNRVAVYLAPFQTGEVITRFLGIAVQLPDQPPPPLYSESRFNGPEGLTMIGDSVVVADVGNNRLLRFPSYGNWSANVYTQSAQGVVGQSDFTSHLPNRGQPQAAQNTLASPLSAVFFNNELFVADAADNRVLVFPQQAGGRFLDASRVLGQTQFNYNTANFIEGRELHFVVSGSNGSFGDAGIVVDTRSNPPHLYVSDAYNNRVLGYRDARTIQTGAKADLVIGQPDLYQSMVNAPGNDAKLPTDQGLRLPTGLALDASGNLYVADSLNGRVLRFPKPFDSGENFPHADLVLGQASFSSRITDPTRGTMQFPYGIAFASDGSLLVSDAAHNRVLLFGGSSQQFSNGMQAAKVFGQPDFYSNAVGRTDNRMAGPRHIAIDQRNRLYVTDTGNNRVQIFDDVTQAGTDPRPVLLLSSLTQDQRINNPRGIYLNQSTGEFWIAAEDGDNHGLLGKYPSFDNLALSPYATAAIQGIPALAIAQDSSGDLYVADFGNRVIIYYPALAALNGASFLDRPLAPGTIASLFPAAGNQPWGNQSLSFGKLPHPLPLPTSMADLQVMVNGQAAPLYYVSPSQINLLVPNGAPSSGTAEFEVQRTSTGQILGSFLVQMDVASPGLFLRGTTQVAALNQNGTINSAQNPAPTGTIIQLFATGPGFVPGAPVDGEPATGQVLTPSKPRVVINPGSGFVPDENITYSGLAPGLVGVWQINVRIPKSVPPGNAVPIFFTYRDIPSINTGQLNTSIAVSQP